MYRLRVRKHFDASHRLPDHKGKCANLHGHHWDVEVEVAAMNVGDGGMVTDFADVKEALEESISDFDHAHLNDLKEFQVAPPTAENVATVIFHRMLARIDGTASVTIWETPTASVTIDNMKMV